MGQALRSVDDLLQAIETPADETGSLAAISELLRPFAPNLLFLGTADGAVLYAGVESQGLFCSRDGGDTWQGSYTSLKSTGSDMVEVMNTLGVEALTSLNEVLDKVEKEPDLKGWILTGKDGC